MTPRCTELDLFFDGELEPDHAAAFRDHLATCERCQRVLLGRMQEAVAADAATQEAASALDAAVADAGVEDPMAAAPDVVAPDAVVDTARPDAGPGASRAANVAAEQPVPVTEAPAPITDVREATRRRRRGLAYAVPIVAAAAALPFIWLGERAPAPLAFQCPIDPGSSRTRGAHVGDILHPTVRGERHRALVVYFERQELRAACPGGARCNEADDTLELQLRLNDSGTYTVVALASEKEIPLPAPGKTLDEYLAQCSGIDVEQKSIRVDD